ncbi:MAG: putative arsenite efflux transporter, partial [Trebouxia sp. A1-2]
GKNRFSHELRAIANGHNRFREYSVRQTKKRKYDVKQPSSRVRRPAQCAQQSATGIMDWRYLSLHFKAYSETDDPNQDIDHAAKEYKTGLIVPTLRTSKEAGYKYDKAVRLTVTQALTSSSNNFGLANAIAVGTFGIKSQEALAATAGPLMKVPVLLALTTATWRGTFGWRPVMTQEARFGADSALGSCKMGTCGMEMASRMHANGITCDAEPLAAVPASEGVTS